MKPLRSLRPEQAVFLDRISGAGERELCKQVTQAVVLYRRDLRLSDLTLGKQGDI